MAIIPVHISLLVHIFLPKINTVIVLRPLHTSHVIPREFLIFPKVKKGWERLATVEETKLPKTMKSTPKMCFEGRKKSQKHLMFNEECFEDHINIDE